MQSPAGMVANRKRVQTQTLLLHSFSLSVSVPSIHASNGLMWLSIPVHGKYQKCFQHSTPHFLLAQRAKDDFIVSGAFLIVKRTGKEMKL